MKRVDIVKSSGGWMAETKSGKAYVEASTKQEVVTKTATKARKSTRPVSVRIHGRDGRIQEERTYPRSDSKSTG
jgi:hypothetical protein